MRAGGKNMLIADGKGARPAGLNAAPVTCAVGCVLKHHDALGSAAALCIKHTTHHNPATDAGIFAGCSDLQALTAQITQAASFSRLKDPESIAKFR